MTLMQWVLMVFVGLEMANVLTLYFAPGSDKGNGVGVFVAFHERARDPQAAALIDYLVNWVAGAKLIFIGLLLLIIFQGDALMHRIALAILLLTTLTFYWRLFPSIRAMDRLQWLAPKGYSLGLGLMILVFCSAFAVALALG